VNKCNDHRFEAHTESSTIYFKNIQNSDPKIKFKLLISHTSILILL